MTTDARTRWDHFLQQTWIDKCTVRLRGVASLCVNRFASRSPLAQRNPRTKERPLGKIDRRPTCAELGAEKKVLLSPAVKRAP